MKTLHLIKSTSISLLVLLVISQTFYSQSFKPTAPRAEKLLNGLNLLAWNVPNSQKATVKLRIHKGAAFDQQGKEGSMALLANILFPNDASRDFFEEDLGGSLEITATHDYLQITATAGKDKTLDVLQALANAILNPQITKETTDAVRDSQLQKVVKLSKEPGYLAETAVAERLFGDFPYGRPVDGSKESLMNIDFVDIIYAKDRFLTSDNATITIESDSRSDLIYKAVARYFGSWLKADSKIPATFRVPDAPSGEIQIVKTSGETANELGIAFRGYARSDKNHCAAEVFAKILSARLQTKALGFVSVSMISNQLPGSFVVKIVNEKLAKESDFVKKTLETVKQEMARPVTSEEFALAKNQTLAEVRGKSLSQYWLDVFTYNLDSPVKDFQISSSISLADVKSVAEQIAARPAASVLLQLTLMDSEVQK